MNQDLKSDNPGFIPKVIERWTSKTLEFRDAYVADKMEEKRIIIGNSKWGLVEAKNPSVEDSELKQTMELSNQGYALDSTKIIAIVLGLLAGIFVVFLITKKWRKRPKEIHRNFSTPTGSLFCSPQFRASNQTPDQDFSTVSISSPMRPRSKSIRTSDSWNTDFLADTKQNPLAYLKEPSDSYGVDFYKKRMHPIIGQSRLSLKAATYCKEPLQISSYPLIQRLEHAKSSAYKPSTTILVDYSQVSSAEYDSRRAESSTENEVSVYDEGGIYDNIFSPRKSIDEDFWSTNLMLNNCERDAVTTTEWKYANRWI